MNDQKNRPDGAFGHLPGRHGIDAYGDGGFRFGDMSHRGSILALPSGIYAWRAVAGTLLKTSDFIAVLGEATAIELLLVGMGTLPLPLPERIRDRLKAAGIRYEVMPTSSAARTYNILVGEGRRVAAALVAVA
jgi:uncharacterized protein